MFAPRRVRAGARSPLLGGPPTIGFADGTPPARSGSSSLSSTLAQAGANIEEANAQHLAGETIRKYKNLLEGRFVGWCDSKGYRLMKQITVDAMREFPATWDVARCTRTKNLERMRASSGSTSSRGGSTGIPRRA